MSDLWNLRKLNLFFDLQSHTMEQILRIVTVKHVEQGEFVFRPGDACDRLYLLQHGRIKTFVNSEQGQEKIMHVFYPGDAFGGLLFGTTYGELPWAQALDDVIVVYMDEAAFKQFMQTFPDLCMNIFRYMADHHADDMRRLESFIHTDAGHRLLLTLLNLGDRLGYGQAESFQLTPGFTHEELANMVGVARTTVSELISQLRREGVLGGYGRCLIVNRRAAEQRLLEQQT
jgi:CRP/FNR family transcriptional regulator